MEVFGSKGRCAMKDEKKTKAQLMEELVELRQRVVEWKAADVEHQQGDEQTKEVEARWELLLQNIPSFIAEIDLVALLCPLIKSNPDFPKRIL